MKCEECGQWWSSGAGTHLVTTVLSQTLAQHEWQGGHQQSNIISIIILLQEEDEPLLSVGCKVPIIKDDPTGPDPKLVFAAHSFVQDIIEKAKAEAARRLKAQNKKVSDSLR